ncbi:sugar phosphate nucleotidyltransferase [Candidatus Spongiihabitans sp.]|uniref:sugar phosphate nucleotidyltransferase n=1 Tax=Candidatus Spongiihabitans sp. TaxID=3101308 RepID=UPI003C7CCBB6
MKAMILAAGKGTRVQPLTYEMPKPMIPVLGKPVMEYLIEQLASHEFRDVMVNVSHLPKPIETYFGDGRRWGINIGYSFEGHVEKGRLFGEPLGSAGGIKRIQEFGGFFDDTFIVVCGDTIIDLDLTAAIRKHWQSGAKASIVVKRVAKERVVDYGVVVADDTGAITSFQEKPTVEEAKSTLVNTGIYIFEPEIIDLIPNQVVYDIGTDLLPDLLARGLPFGAIELPFRWVDIGRLSDYWQANQQLMRGTIRGMTMPGVEVMPQVWTGLNVAIDWDDVLIEGPVYIGSNSRIEAGCEIQGPTWISHGCYLQGGAKVHKSMLFEHTLMRSHGAVFEAVVFGRHCVDKEGRPVESKGSGLDWVGDARDKVLKSRK